MTATCSSLDLWSQRYNSCELWFKPEFMGILDNGDALSSSARATWMGTKDTGKGQLGQNEGYLFCLAITIDNWVEKTQHQQKNSASCTPCSHVPQTHFPRATWCFASRVPKSTPGKECLLLCMTFVLTLADFSCPFRHFPSVSNRDNPLTVRKM